jgi:histone acetyltransferase
MECLLDHRVPHVGIPQMVRAQRAALDSRIRGLSQSHVVHPGLQHFDEAGRRKVIDIMTIPGVNLDRIVWAKFSLKERAASKIKRNSRS